MRKQIKRAVMLSFWLTAVVGGGACLPPPGEACDDGWCAKGYRCASIDLTATCIKSTCGDSVIEADEECDDGNLDDNDGCLQACKLNTCGDGQINFRAEACDDDNGENDDGCDSNCTVTACGNGVVTSGEICDDGNGNDNDGCDSDCTISLLTYLKASNTGVGDVFGISFALSADGTTLAVGAREEASAATDIDGNQADNSALGAGAVYVFTRSGTTWRQQVYIKASYTSVGDYFGVGVALSADGSTLAVGASLADGGFQLNGYGSDWGAVYIFTRSGATWRRQAYIEAYYPGEGDCFGSRVMLSADGSVLAVGASLEDGAATEIGGNQADNSAKDAGAVYVFTRSGTEWNYQAYIKASNTSAGDQFGSSVALSADGTTLAVGARGEDSNAKGTYGNGGNEQADNSAADAGAVYVFVRSGTTWSQQAYVKASNTGVGDYFGASLALSADGSTLAVGASLEDSAATKINGNEDNDGALSAGAVYVFTRSSTTWSQQAYVKASNTGTGDNFGASVVLSAGGATLAVGASSEDSAATGIGDSQVNNLAENSGAVYVFTRSGTMWGQQAYVKASNTDAGDSFGASVVLSADGATLAVGASSEDSAATGIGGNQADNFADNSGAVYVFSSRAW